MQKNYSYSINREVIGKDGIPIEEHMIWSITPELMSGWIKNWYVEAKIIEVDLNNPSIRLSLNGSLEKFKDFVYDFGWEADGISDLVEIKPKYEISLDLIQKYCFYVLPEENFEIVRRHGIEQNLYNRRCYKSRTYFDLDQEFSKELAKKICKKTLILTVDTEKIPNIRMFAEPQSYKKSCFCLVHVPPEAVVKVEESIDN
jgi:hypothetical protein